MITKTTMVVIFNLQNSHLLTLSLPTEEVFQVNGQNRPVANLPIVDFHSQPREMLTPKPLNTQLSVFLLAYWFSSSSRKVLTSLSVSDTVFFSVLAAIIRESSEKHLLLRIVKALRSFFNLTEWHQRRVKCKQLIGCINMYIWVYIFSRVLLRFFPGPDILV